MKQLILVMIILTLATACGGGSRPEAAGRDGRPGWVEHPPEMPGYLYAVGGDKLRVLAIEAAKTEILAQLRVSVDAVSVSQSTYTSVEASGRPRSERLEESIVQDVVQRVEMDDAQTIRVDRETVDDTGTTWVLAVADRSEWATSLRQQINDVDRQLEGAWQVFEAKDSSTESRIATAMRLQSQVVPLAVKRAVLTERYRFVNPRGALPDPVVELGAIRAQISALLDSIPIAIQADEDVERLMPEIVNGLVAAGLPVATDAGKAELLVDLHLDVVSKQVGGLYKLDGEITGTVRDVVAGRHLCGLRAVARESGSDAAIARQRLLRAIAPKVAVALDQSLLEKLTP